MVLGTTGLGRGDDRRFANSVMSTILGGGMSSRLFQSVREQRGLAYSVYCYGQSFRDTGIFGIYAGCIPSKLDTVLEVCDEELQSFIKTGVTTDELNRAKGQVKGGTVLGQEDTGARMTRLGKSELQGEPLLSIDDILKKVEAVTAADVNELAVDLLSKPLAMSVIGPYGQLPDRK
jgi:predicted Zn-dependent peptidase